MTRWIVPIIFALGIHAGLLTLDLSFEHSSVQPSNVTISLVGTPLYREEPRPEEPPQPVPSEKAVHLSKPQKLSKPRPATAPDKDPVPTMRTLPAPPPEPQPPASKAPGPGVGASASTLPDSDQRAALTDAPPLHTSVPLYALNPAPDYPMLARRRNYEGTVMLDVFVDPQGRPLQVKLHQSSGYSMLDQSAAATVRRWRFEPARRGAQAIEMWVRVPVRFELD
jgi:periplasmic protein TonB